MQGKALQDDGVPEAAPCTSHGRASRRRRNPRSGGVLFPRDSKSSWAVNVRPKNWGDKDKIWWGKIKSMKEAQRISDIVHYYLGCESVHLLFPGADRPPPQFLNLNLRHINSMERRMQYVKLIAKGDEHQARRKEFMESVKEMVKFLTVENEEAQPELGGIDECRLSPEIPDLHQGNETTA